MVPWARHAMYAGQRVRLEQGAVAALRGRRPGKSFRAPPPPTTGRRADHADAGPAAMPPPRDQSAGPRSPSPMSRGGMRLGELLVDRRLVTPAQVSEALQLQRQGSAQRLGEILVGLGVLDERDLVDPLSQLFDIPTVDLRSQKPDPAAVALIPERVARANLALPVSLSDGSIQVAVAEPSNELRRQLAQASGRGIELMMAPASDVRRAIDSSYRALGGVDQLVQAFEAVESSRKRGRRPRRSRTSSPTTRRSSRSSTGS